MKLKHITLLFSSIIFANSVANAQDPTPGQHPATAQTPTPSVATGTVNISIEDLQKYLSLENEIKQLQERAKLQLDSVKKADDLEIKRLQEEVESNKKLVDAYQRKYINLISNFLYVPYDEYSVENIVRPAYEEIKNTKLAQENQIRFDLIFKYKEDLQQISNFCKSNEKNLKMINAARIGEDTAKIKESFNALPSVQMYKKYTDYKNTYIGSIIEKIDNLLSHATGMDKAKINSTFTNIQGEIDALLKQANQ